jgi:hypothetical protein
MEDLRLPLESKWRSGPPGAQTKLSPVPAVARAPPAPPTPPSPPVPPRSPEPLRPPEPPRRQLPPVPCGLRCLTLCLDKIHKAVSLIPDEALRRRVLESLLGVESDEEDFADL